LFGKSKREERGKKRKLKVSTSLSPCEASNLLPPSSTFISTRHSFRYFSARPAEGNQCESSIGFEMQRGREKDEKKMRKR